MASEKVTIDLQNGKVLKGPNGETFTKVIVREPTFDEYLIHGDPYTVAQAQGGTPFAVENEDNIRAYINLCLVEPKDPQILKQGNALLARQVKNAILSFFRPDEPAGEVSATSPTNSPSEASGAEASTKSET